MSDLSGILANIEVFSADTIEAEFKAFIESRELGFGQVLLPFRIALTGAGGGPSMFEFAEFLGKEKTLERLESGVKNALEIKVELST